MGTWTTDILGTGLAHHAPTRQERVLARRILLRWKEWQPLLQHELRSRPHPPGYVARELIRLEHRHAEALMGMLASNIRWQRIVQSRLDDPRVPADERARRIANPYYGAKDAGARRRERNIVIRAERQRQERDRLERDADARRSARGLRYEDSFAATLARRPDWNSDEVEQ